MAGFGNRCSEHFGDWLCLAPPKARLTLPPENSGELNTRLINIVCVPEINGFY